MTLQPLEELPNSHDFSNFDTTTHLGNRLVDFHVRCLHSARKSRNGLVNYCDFTSMVVSVFLTSSILRMRSFIMFLSPLMVSAFTLKQTS